MMKRFLFVPFLFVALSVFAQTPTDPAPVADKPATPAVEPAAPVAVPDVVKVEGDKVTVNDVITNATEVAAAVKNYQDAKKAGDKTAIRLGIMALLAAVFKILLSVLKFTSDFWKGTKGKLVLRLSTLVLGVAVFFTAHMAAGESWVNAGLLAVSGPLAIAVHELFDVILPLLQKKTKTELAAKPA